MKKKLKWLGIILGILLVLFIVMGIVMPKDFTIQKSEKMDVPPSVAYNILNDISLQPEWNPWLKEDDKMNITFADNTTGEGAAYVWTSEKMGNGSQTIKKSELNKHVGISLDMENEDPMDLSFDIEGDKEKSKVTWTFKGRQGFPMNVFTPFMKFFMGRSFNKGLSSIEKMAENRWEKGEYYGIPIKIGELPRRYYALRRSMIPADKVQGFYMTHLGGVFQAVQSAGEEMDGSPSGLIFGYDNKGNVDIAAGVPVKDEINLVEVASLTMDEGPGIQVDHYGDYASIPKTHEAIQVFLRDRGLVYKSPYTEEYVSDPSKITDPEKVLTKIYYYLADSGMTK